MNRLTALITTTAATLLLGFIAFDTTPAFDQWKADTDAAEAAAKTKFDSFPTTPCTEGHELTKAFIDWKTAHTAKFTDLRNHWAAQPTTVCEAPQPPPASGLPSIFTRLTFSITYESTLGFSQASDVTYNRRTGKPVIVDQLNRIVFVDQFGTLERAITIDCGGLPDPRPNHDWEAIQYLGSDGAADEFVICFEPSPARLFWVKIGYDQTTPVVLTPSTETYSLPGLSIEAMACDYHTPNVLHLWTYGSTADTHAVVTRGNPTTHVNNPLYTGSWVSGFRGAFWNVDYCPNPIKVGCSQSDVTLRELNHTDNTKPLGSVISSSPTFTRSLRKFEGGCFMGSDKKICLVAENNPTNFFILEAP